MAVGITPEVLTYYIATNPLIDVKHCGEVPAGGNMLSGQPIAVFSTDKTELLDLIYSSYTENEGGDDIDWVADGSVDEDVAWSVYTSEEDVNAVEADLNSFDFLRVNKIKHPDRDEWAIPVQASIFANMPSGDAKLRLGNAATLSISENRRKTKAEMLADGWIV